MYRYPLAISMVFLVGISAFCPVAGAEELITAQEYEIFRLALATQQPYSELNPETLAMVKAGADWLNPPTGIHITADMANAFNAKNLTTYKLSDDFLAEVSQRYGNNLTDKKKITLSRPGFDNQMRHAMLIIALVYYHPEDVMNEGMYVFLEKHENQWKVVHTAKAWDVRLGPTP